MPRLKRQARKADREREFAIYLRAMDIGGWEQQFYFHPERRWRFDFAWPQCYIASKFRLAIEIEGLTRYGRRKSECKGCGREIVCIQCGTKAPGEMILGAHQTADGVEKDLEKYAEALRLGWIVFRISQKQLDLPETFDLIRKLVGDGGPLPPEQESMNLNEPEF